MSNPQEADPSLDPDAHLREHRTGGQTLLSDFGWGAAMLVSAVPPLLRKLAPL